MDLSLELVGVMELWLAVAVVASLAKLLTLLSLLIGVEEVLPFVKGSEPKVSCRWPLVGTGGGFSSTGNIYDNIAARITDNCTTNKSLPRVII